MGLTPFVPDSSPSVESKQHFCPSLLEFVWCSLCPLAPCLSQVEAVAKPTCIYNYWLQGWKNLSFSLWLGSLFNLVSHEKLNNDIFILVLFFWVKYIITCKIQINSLGKNKPIFFIKIYYSKSFSLKFIPDCFQMCLLPSSSQFHAKKASQCSCVLDFCTYCSSSKGTKLGKSFK